MGFTLDVGVSAVTVFIQGLLSFFSPCVLPLLPVYIGYLSGGTAVRDEDGKMHYDRGRVALNTLFFVIGISAAFFLLGLGLTAVGHFLSAHQLLIARIGGVLIILFGLYQLGVFGKLHLLSRERRIPLRLEKMTMSPLTALVMGFVFSFAWTPCVGPTLSSVLIMAASASTRAKGLLYIGVYTLGFVIPFLALGLFSTSLLDLFRRHRGVVRWTVKVGGVLLILMGVMMLTGWMTGLSGLLSGAGQTDAGSTPAAVTDTVSADAATPDDGGALPAVEDARDTPSAAATPQAKTGEDAVGQDASEPAPTATPYATPEAVPANEYDPVPAIDFELYDQYGNLRRLSDYQGRIVFLNFWATWCPPCRAEMPDIQKLYEQYGDNGDVVILGVASPGHSGEGDVDSVKDFLASNGYTYPVVMDTSGDLIYQYGISAVPTTFMISADGTVFGYMPGSMSLEIMQEIIAQTMAGNYSAE